MSVSEYVERAPWSIAEAHTIAVAAYGRCLEVEPYRVLERLDLWRKWFYGMVPTSAVSQLPGVRIVPSTEL